MRKAGALALIALIVLAISAGSTFAAVARVTNSNDAGLGSFRAAIAKANTDASVGRIDFRFGLAPVMLVQPIVYSGGQSLDILGGGAVLDGTGLAPSVADAFLVTGGGDLSITALTIQNAPQQGLTYQVPTTATGSKNVTLVGVQILGNDGHGVLINDQEDPNDTGDPDANPQVHGNSNGSSASLDVRVIGSRFAENGFLASDRDGLRVNEGGLGTLNAVISLSRFHHNGADGIELDERGEGDAVFNVSGTQLTLNGELDPADLDDGMDVDEVDGGSLVGKVVASSANDNFEEGWDLNENDAGDFRVDMTLAEASRNGEEGFDFEEDDDFQGGGDLITSLTAVKADGNGASGGDAGLKIRERGDGKIDATVRGSETNDNLSGGINVREQGNGDLQTAIERATANGNRADGINAREDDTGNLNATVARSTASGNAADGIEFEENGVGNLTASADRSTTDGNAEDGVEFDENGAGNLTGAVSRGSSASNNVGVRADQQASVGDVGALTLATMALSGNVTAVVANAGVTVTQTP